ncbi:hypothetical protein [Phytohabitans houttuyneae]|uniref:Asp23/Gls24 family envelope stress response protein n=1 Tax=Phytohabitans houttuyneae TaxID=1076126 RepID=A0A6V8KWP9_9ACTN|nr:hypothetical protein [Phytohabitans houttuyneae]GFJ86276.1 hypothetical protein Phou_104560 [Phytohabitans houttuyneae]
MITQPRELALAVRDAVTAVPGVRQVRAGSAVEVATQYPGGKVSGVRVSGETVEVHVVVGRLPLQPVVGQARAAARAVLDRYGDPRPVTVVVVDVADDAFAGADTNVSLAAGASDVARAIAAGALPPSGRG